MISVSGKNWDETIINKRLVDKISYEEDFSEIISKIIISRKFDKSEIYSINNDVVFFFYLIIIFFADLILSEVGVSRRTGIFFFNRLIVCFSCN